MTGKTISHFKIIEKLGSGGMGVVYKAEDTKLKRQVALKFLPSAIAEDSEERIRFEREAQAAAALDHPCIAAVHEIAESEGQMFIVMACVEGVSLKKKIKSGPLTVEEAIDIAIQIAQGLKEAHDLGIVHRDIKSANVIVSPKGQVKITDFGLAKFKDEKTLTKSGAQMGSASYMSPEQIRGEPVDHQSDLFSIGVVLYEMLTGQLPFKGEDVHAQMFSIVYDLPQPVAMLKPEVPEALERIVERALKKQKEQRYQSIDELLTDLQALKRNMASGQAVHFDPGITKKGKLHKSTRDRKRTQLKRVTVLLAFALLLSVAFVLFRLVFHKQAVTAAPR
ncbi:MAG: serine/threonine protein kinase, partial [bacterium]